MYQDVLQAVTVCNLQERLTVIFVLGDFMLDYAIFMINVEISL